MSDAAWALVTAAAAAVPNVGCAVVLVRSRFRYRRIEREHAARLAAEFVAR